MLTIRDLAREAKKVHHVTITYEGQEYTIPWMELADDEYPKDLDDMPKDATEEEKNEAVFKLLDQVTFSAISKAMLAQSEHFERIDWNAIPKRLRVVISLEIFEDRKKVQESFLGGRART